MLQKLSHHVAVNGLQGPPRNRSGGARDGATQSADRHRDSFYMLVAPLTCGCRPDTAVVGGLTVTSGANGVLFWLELLSEGVDPPCDHTSGGIREQFIPLHFGALRRCPTRAH